MNRPTVSLANTWHFPTPEVVVLAGGLTVWAFDLPGQHIAALELVMPTSLTLEPRALEGVATIALHAADEGTAPHPDGRVTELLELQGAALHGHAGHHRSQLGGDAPVHRLPAVVALLSEVLVQPEFAAHDIDHHVEMEIAAFDSRVASPGWVAKQALRQLLFGANSREGRPTAGTPETLLNITRDDVVAWHAQHWAATDTILVVAGDLSRVSLRPALAPLEQWSGTMPQPPSTPAPTSAAQLAVVDMPDAVQATVHVGGLTVGRRHPDWAALKLGGHAMCGAFASRLNLELRERLGYTYGVSGGFSARLDDGQFSVGGSFRVDVAAEALRHLMEELALARPFTTAEIEDAKAFLIGVAPLANETAADIASQAAVLASVGEHPSFVNEHFAALRLPTAEAVTEAMRRHVRTDNLSIAVSGPADTVVPALSAAGMDPVIVS